MPQNYIQQQNLSTLNVTLDVLEACVLARDAEWAGDFDGAVVLIQHYWKGVGVSPDKAGLDELRLATLMLRVGALSGWIGSELQVVGSQELAKNMLTISREMFCDLRLSHKVAEVDIEMSACYRRTGDLKNSRDILLAAIHNVDSTDRDLKAMCLLRLATAEISANNHEGASRILMDNYPLLQHCSNPMIKGRVYNALAGALNSLYDQDPQPSYMARVLIELKNAAACFKLANHITHFARVNNNIGLTLLNLKRYDEAFQYLNTAYEAAVKINSVQVLAIVNDTRAQYYLALGDYGEAEKIIISTIRAIEAGDEEPLLPETLITHGRILLKTRRLLEADAVFQRAIQIADFADNGMAIRRAVKAQYRESSENVISIFDARQMFDAMFSWRMPDDSLKDVGVLAGDAVTFRRAVNWNDGDLVAVETPNGKFVKFIHRHGDNKVRLLGAHEKCRERVYFTNEIKILGLGVAQES